MANIVDLEYKMALAYFQLITLACGIMFPFPCVPGKNGRSNLIKNPITRNEKHDYSV